MCTWVKCFGSFIIFLRNKIKNQWKHWSMKKLCAKLFVLIPSSNGYSKLHKLFRWPWKFHTLALFGFILISPKYYFHLNQSSWKTDSLVSLQVYFSNFAFFSKVLPVRWSSTTTEIVWRLTRFSTWIQSLASLR